MSAIDSKDSIEINCRAEKVFNVVSDYNYQNRWFPGYRCKIRNSESIFEGAIVDHIYGKPPFILGRFTRRIEKIDYPFRLEESYIFLVIYVEQAYGHSKSPVEKPPHHSFVASMAILCRLGCCSK